MVLQTPNEIPEVLLVCSVYESFTLRAALIGGSVLHRLNRPFQLVHQGLHIVCVKAELKAFTQIDPCFQSQ
jgi:hypothetical protein